MKLDELTFEQRREVCLHLGNMLLNLPIASVLMRHTNTVDTIRGSYLVASDEDPNSLWIAKKYLVDLLQFRSKAVKLVEKWYTPNAVRNHLELVRVAVCAAGLTPSNPTRHAVAVTEHRLVDVEERDPVPEDERHE